VKYKIRLVGMKSREGTIPLTALKEIAESILKGSEGALRFSIEGASIKTGPTPEWLKKSLELTVTGISKGSTVLEVEAPILLDTAPEQVGQQDFWYSRPEPDDTSISLLSRSFADAVSGNKESEHYDQGVLKTLSSFKPLLDNYVDEVKIIADDRPEENFQFRQEDLSTISKLRHEMRQPQAVVISGIFNLIEHAERRFQLNQEDGHKIYGKAESSFISEHEMRNFWGKKVTVKGTAYFNLSGKIRLIEAQTIKSFETGEQIFESVPELMFTTERLPSIKKGKSVKSPLLEIWGKWPGSESIEDLLTTLTDISREE
jgi:hypothetical protein